MSKDTKLTSRDLRAVSAINLIINVTEQLTKVKTDLEELGLTYARSSEIRRDIQHLRAIMYTTADPIANDLLTKKINKLEYEISEQFTYLPLIKKCLREVWDVFRFATGKHFQKYDEITQNAMVQSMAGITIVDEPKIHFLPNKLKRKKRISND